MAARKVVGPDGWLYPEGTTFSDRPRDPSEIATDENLALAALDGQMRIAKDEADPFTMTQDKLEAKTAGMGAASLQLPDPTYARFRDEDEEILRDEQAKFKEDEDSCT